MKKIISILLVAVLLFSLAPMSFAEVETYKYQYIIKDSIGGIILADCTIESTNSQLAYTDMPFSSGDTAQHKIAEWKETDEDGAADVQFPVSLTAGTTKVLYGYISEPNIVSSITYHYCESAKNENVGCYVEGKTLPLSNPSKTGYNFSKWTLTDDSTAEAVTSIPTTQTGDVDVYAWWTAHTYTVKYDPNGGTGDTMQDSDMTYDDGTQALRKNTYTNTGYVFSGWALEATGEKKFDDEQVKPNVTAKDGETVTLFAVWAPLYSVSYVSLSETGGSASYSKNSGTPVSIGTTLTTVSDYVLNDSIVVTATPDANYYARITDGADISKKSSTKGETISYTVSKESILTNNPTIYVSFYEGAKVTVSFNANGGSAVTEPITPYVGDVYGKLPESTLTGYYLEGWYTEMTGGTKITATSKVTNTENHTLYAHWAPISYLVHFDSNGGTSGEMSDQVITYDVETKLTKNAFAKTGYKFAGWAKESGAAAADYTDEATVKNLKNTEGAVQNLYAVWTKYTVYTQTTSTTGGTATYKLGSNTAVAITATAQSISLASTETLVVTATPTSGYYAKIYTDSNKSGTYECYKSSDSKGAAISYTLTQADIEAGITVKVLYSTNPITGDTFDPMLWVIALAAAGAGAAITIAAKKKAHN